MPTRQFTRELSVGSTVEHCWKVLTDVPRLVDWVSIVEDAHEIAHLSRYTAVLMDRLGPFKLRADLDIDVTEVEPPNRIRVRAAGEDRQVGSRLAVDAVLSLRPEGEARTSIRVSGTYEVTGRVAAMGAGTINKKAEHLLDDFFGRAEAELGSR
jgi:carbon monoxide dehydrogenase subunit G